MSAMQAEKQRLQASIARERRELEIAIAELRSTAEQALDPRERIARRPYRWLLLAFMAGVWLGRPRTT